MQTRTRTRTVVFTDMADYTRRTSESDREGLRNLLAMHQRFVEPVLTGRGGRIVKNIGDSFMALFESATDAARACMDLVEAHDASRGSDISFRAGIATGDVEEIENDAFGEPVNLASRIIARTPNGEVWFSAATWHCLNQAEIPWESAGRHSLKGIPWETEVFRAVPLNQAWLPEALAAAARARTLVIWRSGDPVPVLLPNSQLVLEGFRPGSPALNEAVDRLPLLEPTRLWLSTYNVSPNDRNEWVRNGRGLVIGTPGAVRAAIHQQIQASSRSVGSDTIILDTGSASVLDLVVAGLALPAVPLSEVVAGYSYDLAPDGRWLNRSERALLRVDVSFSGATVVALAPGVTIGTHSAAPTTPTLLQHDMAIHTPAGVLRYVALAGQEGYLGALVGDSQVRLGVGTGQQVEFGREPNHPGLLLPDRNSQDNIRWLPGPRATRARERGFTLDKVLTGRHHAALQATGKTFSVIPLHETCATFLVDAQNRVHRLSEPTPAVTENLLLLGTMVIALREPAF
ncbi:MAG: adenylate/guanylate cyclase domain-containing protein [Pseudomonadota bacterium]|nr:adenylate/guanylate cyclase domain-containing protein [Pseudomonadota bacterium]